MAEINEVLKQIEDYSIRKKLNYTPSLIIEVDESGLLCMNPFKPKDLAYAIFHFDSVDELLLKLKE